VFTIEELSTPRSLDSADATPFEEMVAVRNAVETQILGGDVLSHSAVELLPGFRNVYKPRRLFVAGVGGRMVGRAVVSWLASVNSPVSSVNVEVLRRHRGRGIGTALLDRMERIARESGRATVQSHVEHSALTGGSVISPPTRFGQLSLDDDPGVRFLANRGYVLEQIKRISFLGLPMDAARLNELVQTAQRAAGPVYALVEWTGATPNRWLTDVAWLKTRMSTDNPTAGLDSVEDPWDEARLLQRDRDQQASGRSLFTVAVEHLPSGRVAGFSELSLPDVGRAARQEDTLVLSEHRGLRLGMLLKAANLRQLGARADLIYTFNAEENRPMLAVNEAVGFRPASFEGGWRKALI
jgi:GNAT superfamily N-acetyltransferase